MDPRLNKAAEEGDVMYLATRIVRINRTVQEELALGILRINGTAEEENRYGQSEDRRLLNTTQEGRNNILHLAAKAGHDLFVALALQFLPSDLSNQVNSQGETPLLVAAKFGHLNVAGTIKKPKIKFQIRRDVAAGTTTLIGTYSSGSSSRDVEEGLVDIPLELGTIHDDKAIGYLSSSCHQRDTEERIAVKRMDPELYEAAKKGDESCLSGINGRNITEDVAVGIQDGKFLTRTQHGNNNILHIAARAGHKTFVVEALKCFPFLSEQVNREGDTPLIVAARFGHLEVVKKLAPLDNDSQMQDDIATAVENGTNSRSSRRQGDIEEGQIDGQLERGTIEDKVATAENDTNSRSSRGQGDIEEGQIDDQLEQATIEDNVATVENETNSSIICHHQREEEEGPIDNQVEQAASSENGTNSMDVARMRKFMNDSSQSDDGVRCKFEDLPIHRLWRVKNLKPDTTALHEALRNGHENVARYFIVSCPKMLTSVNGAGESPLYLAAESNCQTFMMDVFKSKHPYSTEGPQGQNALHAARHCDDGTIFRLIFENQDLTRKMDNRGKAPIHYAVEADYSVWFDQMLKADATIVLLGDNEGYTPLLRAASRGCWNICKEILQECPEAIEARNNKGQHALHLAKAKFGAYPPEMMELVNVGDDEGDTPLHLAVKENQYEKAISLTYSASINLGAVNKGGLTALDICESDCQHITIKRLMWHHLTKLGAPRGRNPNRDQLPVGGPKGVIRSRYEDGKDIINTLALVAALLATLTFTAAYTMPGGYDSSSDNLGVSTLAKKAALKVFILSDTLAMCCSIHALFLLLHAMRVEKEVAVPLRNTSRTLVFIALLATLVAFMSGIFAVIAPKAFWVGILVCVICSVTPYLFFPSTVQKLSPTILINDFLWIIRRNARRTISESIDLEIFVLRAHVDRVIGLKNLIIETIQQHYTV